MVSDADAISSVGAASRPKRVRSLLRGSGTAPSSVAAEAEKAIELRDRVDPNVKGTPPANPHRLSPMSEARERRRIRAVLQRSGNPRPTWETVSGEVLIELGVRSPSRGARARTPIDNLPDVPESWRITPPLSSYAHANVLHGGLALGYDGSPQDLPATERELDWTTDSERPPPPPVGEFAEGSENNEPPGPAEDFDWETDSDAPPPPPVGELAEPGSENNESPEQPVEEEDFDWATDSDAPPPPPVGELTEWSERSSSPSCQAMGASPSPPRIAYPPVTPPGTVGRVIAELDGIRDRLSRVQSHAAILAGVQSMLSGSVESRLESAPQSWDSYNRMLSIRGRQVREAWLAHGED